MDAEREALVAQVARSHNIARNARVLRALCYAHLLRGRGIVSRGGGARRQAASWNLPPEPGQPLRFHPLPCLLEIQAGGRTIELSEVCGTEFGIPAELHDPGPCAIFDETDAALEGFDGAVGLCQAFEEAVARVLRDRGASVAFRPDPRVVEDAFRRYRSSALEALAALRHNIGFAENSDDEGWPEPGSGGFRYAQLAVLHGYEATLVSPGLRQAILGEVQAFTSRRFRT